MAVGYEHSPGLPQILRQAGCSVLISTYQAGQLIALGVTETDEIGLSFRRFGKAMGIAVSDGAITVGAREQVWTLREKSDIAARIPPAGRYDRCYLPRSSVFTGDIHIHEIAWGRGTDGLPELWAVNTGFSALVGLHPEHHFVPRWKPPFITDLADEDRCHLNGMAMRDGRPEFVTVLAPGNERAGWRKLPPDSGAVLHVPSGEPVLQGLTMPHSPRWHDGHLYVLNSGRGLLLRVDPNAGTCETVASVPGYARGLALHGGLAFIGLSRIRETATFGRVPLVEHHDELLCGLGVIDLATGATVGTLVFVNGVEEIFDIQVVPGARSIALSTVDNDEIWTVPSHI